MSILHLEDRKLTFYQTPYEQFAETRTARIAAAQSEAKKQEARRAHLQTYVDRFRYKADKARQAQSRLKAIARMKPITTPQEAALKKFTFPTPEALSPPIINIEGVAVGYGGPPVLSQLSLTHRPGRPDRAFWAATAKANRRFLKMLAGKLDPNWVA